MPRGRNFSSGPVMVGPARLPGCMAAMRATTHPGDPRQPFPAVAPAPAAHGHPSRPGAWFANVRLPRRGWPFPTGRAKVQPHVSHRRKRSLRVTRVMRADEYTITGADPASKKLDPASTFPLVCSSTLGAAPAALQSSVSLPNSIASTSVPGGRASIARPSQLTVNAAVTNGRRCRAGPPRVSAFRSSFFLPILIRLL